MDSKEHDSQKDETGFEQLLDRAQEGDAEAQFKLGKMYHQGQGVLNDDKEAVKWWRKAADQGHREAKFYLATTAWEILLDGTEQRKQKLAERREQERQERVEGAKQQRQKLQERRKLAERREQERQERVEGAKQQRRKLQERRKLAERREQERQERVGLSRKGKN